MDQSRTLSTLQTDFADNTSNNITAQYLRDFLVSSYQPQGVSSFRLGLEDGVFVSTSDQTGKSNIYLNPGTSNRLGLTDGTSWVQFTPTKIGLGGLTGLTSGANYDVFAAYSTPTHSSTNTGTDIVTWTSNPGWTTGTYVIVTSTGGGLTQGTDYWYNRASGTTGSFHTTLANAIAGTSKVDLTSNITQTLVGLFIDLGPTWNTGGGSDTARGTGAGSTALTTLNSAYVNSVSVTGSIGAGTIGASAGVYLGSIRTTSTTQTEDSVTKRFSWSNFNRFPRKMLVQEATASWTYTTNTWRQARASSANQIEYVCGMQNDLVFCDVYGMVVSTTAGNGGLSVGIGIDSTSTNSADLFGGIAVSTASTFNFPKAQYSGPALLGYHKLVWLEISEPTTGTTTWYGTPSSYFQTGISGCVYS